MNPDFDLLRREFPVLASKTYLNSGSYCALSNSVRAAFDAYLEDRLILGANWDQWVLKNEAVRELVAKLLHATSDEVAVTASVTAGLNALATAFDFRGTRNKVVISDFEFPTNAQVWYAQEMRGAEIVRVPCDPDGYISVSAFENVVDERTALVAVTHVCFRNGAKLDIGGITRLAHAHGARMLVDSYQAAGAVDIDVRKLDVDFLVGGMLKYLLGTAGIGFLYVRRDLIDLLHPSHTGWFAQENIAAMDVTGNHPSPTARRFEAGTPPVVNCYASEAGLEFLLKVGTSAVERRNQYLTRRCMDRLEEIGWPSVTPRADERRGATVAIPSRASGQLSQELMKREIVTSYRDDNVRASFHFYNDDSDIEALISALRDLRSVFAPV